MRSITDAVCERHSVPVVLDQPVFGAAPFGRQGFEERGEDAPQPFEVVGSVGDDRALDARIGERPKQFDDAARRGGGDLAALEDHELVNAFGRAPWTRRQ